MALTRSLLEGLGIPKDQIQIIIEAHTETTDGLKKQRDQYKADADKYKADAEKLPIVTKERDELKAVQTNPDEWKEKYEKEHSDFEAFKAAQTEKETAGKKETAYRELLKTAGVAEKRIDTIIKVTDIKGLELTEDDKLKDSDALTKTIKETWSDFITTTEETGAETHTPPETSGGSAPKDIPSFF